MGVNMDTKRVVASALVVVALPLISGCWHSPVKEPPPPPALEVTLESLICAVQDAIVATRREGSDRAGLAPAEATVTAALTFKTIDAGELGAKLKVGIVEWGPKVSRSVENGYANTVSIKFTPGQSHFTVMKADGNDAVAVMAPGDKVPLNGCKQSATF